MRLARFRITVAAALAAFVTAGAAAAVTLPFHPTAKQGVFLQVSDIHFNPFADPAIVPQLVRAPVDQWESLFEKSKLTRFAQYGEDTNFPLFKSMLVAAESLRYSDGKEVHFDYLLNTGDNLAHEFRKKYLTAGGKAGDYRNFVIKTVLFVNHMLLTSFPRIPLIYALGNNDAVCGDYQVTPASAMLARIGKALPVLRGHPQARKDFARGGYYIVPHPTVPRHDVIVLNSVFWSTKYRDSCGAKRGDPGARELAWLKKTLAREKTKGRSATLAMHIPPGFDAYSSSHRACPQPGVSFWHRRYTRRFLALIDADRKVLRTSYAGHTHMDDFRVLSDAHRRPFLTMRVTPSVSPVFGNNPAFTVLLYRRSNAMVRNYAVFRLTNLTTADAGAPAQWALEYTFAQTYGAQGYTPAHIAALARDIRSDATLRQSFEHYYAVEAPSSPISADNWLSFACAQTAMTRAIYAACRCPSATPPR